jgi:hypothetical protein
MARADSAEAAAVETIRIAVVASRIRVSIATSEFTNDVGNEIRSARL